MVVIKSHKIAKVMWDAFKLMYAHLNKTSIVVFKKIPIGNER
jgi:hypothetical protein